MYLGIFFQSHTKTFMQKLNNMDCLVYIRNPDDPSNKDVLNRTYVFCADEEQMKLLCKRHKGVMMGPYSLQTVRRGWDERRFRQILSHGI